MKEKTATILNIFARKKNNYFVLIFGGREADYIYLHLVFMIRFSPVLIFPNYCRKCCHCDPASPQNGQEKNLGGRIWAAYFTKSIKYGGSLAVTAADRKLNRDTLLEKKQFRFCLYILD